MNRPAVGSRRWIRHYRAGLTVGTVAVAVAAFAVLLLRGAGWLYGPGLHRLTPDQQVTAIDDVRGRLIQLGAGLLAAGALVFTARNFWLSREGHVTDRYTKAIEQLGSERLDVRLGAIYALERIMIDSERDHPTIVEVLAAFIREHANPDTYMDAYRARFGRPTFTAEDKVLPDKPPADVEAALTVLGRRPRDRVERGLVNLRGAHLSGATLFYGANLADPRLSHDYSTRAYFTRAYLTGANLAGANLTRANLGLNDLDTANLTDADLTGANLWHANLTGANLTGANLTRARLPVADLRRADLAHVVLTDAFLAGASLAGANLMGANLTRADMTDAFLTGAYLIGADMTRANLRRADLNRADLTRADLTGANLTEANLTHADLTDANLTGAILTGAVLPAGYVGSTQPDPNPDSSSGPPSAS